MPAAGIIVLGSINVDLVVRVPRMPRPGETVLGGRFATNLGGKGANQAVAAARAARGAVQFLAAVGDDAYGREALTTLSGEPGLNTDLVKTVAGAATGVALITVDAQGENMISVASGANALFSVADIDAVPAAVWRGAKVLLACLETPLATVVRALERAKQFGLTTILNPAPAARDAGAPDVLRLVDILTPNEGEALALAGGADSLPPVDAAQQLLARGARCVIVTLGREGCAVVGDLSGSASGAGQDVSEQQVLRVPARPVTAVDTTAAGDAFSGALAVAIAEGRPLAEAVKWASAAAAISVTRAGAIPSLATRSEIESFG